MYIKQASEYLRLSECTLQRWEKKGVLRPERIGKRGDRWYTQEMLDKFIKYRESFDN